MHLVEDDVVGGGEVVEAEGQPHHEEGDGHAVHREVEREGVLGTPIKGWSDARMFPGTLRDVIKILCTQTQMTTRVLRELLCLSNTM